MASNIYSHKLRERVVHSSLSEFTSRSPDLSIIGGTVRIGILVRTGYHSSHQRQMGEVCWESPNVESLTQGEFVELDELDDFVRTKLIEISKHCTAQGKELIEQGKRLMAIATSTSVLDNLPDVNDKPKNIQSTQSTSTQSVPSRVPTTTVTSPPPRSTVRSTRQSETQIDTDLLNEIE